jgi:hypothetical protein
MSKIERMDRERWFGEKASFGRSEDGLGAIGYLSFGKNIRVALYSQRDAIVFCMNLRWYHVV